jgi:ADP-ribose pyrophosphatase YjhB (NUDIX family)
VAAYAVIVRDERILLSKLAPWITTNEQWTLPGGGIDHGEDPRHAVVREILEETGLDAVVGEQARVYSAHQARMRRDGRRSDYHALRIVYDGWVPPDAPEPRVVEVDGSTVDSAWLPLGDVLDGTVPTVPMVQQALTDWSPFRMQRVGAYALVRRGDRVEGDVLLVRFSVKGFHTGSWSLPGGGIDHGEDPRDGAVREVEEETGYRVELRQLLTVESFRWLLDRPGGPIDHQAICVIYTAEVVGGELRDEIGGSTDTAAWIPLDAVADLERGGLVDVGLAVAGHLPARGDGAVG